MRDRTAMLEWRSRQWAEWETIKWDPTQLRAMVSRKELGQVFKVGERVGVRWMITLTWVAERMIPCETHTAGMAGVDPVAMENRDDVRGR